ATLSRTFSAELLGIGNPARRSLVPNSLRTGLLCVGLSGRDLDPVVEAAERNLSQAVLAMPILKDGGGLRTRNVIQAGRQLQGEKLDTILCGLEATGSHVAAFSLSVIDDEKGVVLQLDRRGVGTEDGIDQIRAFPGLGF